MATNFSLPTQAKSAVARKALSSNNTNPENRYTAKTTTTNKNSSRHPYAVDQSPRLQESRSSPVKIRLPSIEALQPISASLEDAPRSDNSSALGQPDSAGTVFSHVRECLSGPDSNSIHSGLTTLHQGSTPDMQKSHISNFLKPDTLSKVSLPNSPVTKQSQRSGTPTIHLSSQEYDEEPLEQPQLQYFHFATDHPHANSLPQHGDKRLLEKNHYSGPFTSNSPAGNSLSANHAEAGVNVDHASRPSTPQILGSDLNMRGRSLSPAELVDDGSLPASRQHRRDLSSASSRRSFDPKQASHIDLLNIPYTQQMAQQNVSLDNAKLRASVGTNASLLDTKKTLEMYRANVKKTNDSAIQYEFAIFMVNAAQDAAVNNSMDNALSGEGLSSASSQTELLREARQILQKLADKSYVFAQYYLADGYASGLFNNGKDDYERGFPLFLSAAKHGHAEAGYRTALCYEFGWGSRKDFAKAVQFYRQAASKNHPGAAIRLGKACLTGDMGLVNKYKEGVKWLKRAAESADVQHNSGPFELGLLHLTGYGEDVFKDEAYAAQLFTKSAELCHAEANLRMGEAYEHGLLTCPRDPALSIHFYTGAAQAGVPRAMMALCAWYMVGAEPLLDKDEVEAYEWAKRAAESELPKAEYAVGYFTEMGIGCRRDPLEANVWYVKAADHGDERAKQRLAIIREAETGDAISGISKLNVEKDVKKKRNNIKGHRDDKDCLVM